MVEHLRQELVAPLHEPLILLGHVLRRRRDKLLEEALAVAAKRRVHQPRRVVVAAAHVHRAEQLHSDDLDLLL